MKPDSQGSEPARTSSLTVAKAAENLPELIRRVSGNGETIVLTEGGKPVAEIIPFPERRMTPASKVRKALKSLPHLGTEETEAFARDLEEARSKVSAPARDPWESSSTARS